MARTTITVSSPVPKSYRSAKVQGMYDVPAQDVQTVTIEADLSAIEERDWSIGAIVGSSGRGKSTLARTLWPDDYVAGFDWSADCILDDFPKPLKPDAIVQALTAVGFSSAPAWLRPYRVLSTGQQQRADLARALLTARPGEPMVFDEFTSVVDRVVAKSASVAIARHVRRTSSRFIAVTCHRDVLPWLQADWSYDVDTETLTWGSQCRPDIRLTVSEGVREAWTAFRGHHYLTGDLSRSARVFVAHVELGDEPPALCGFFSLLPSMGHKGWWRGHRTVVLPDYQGLGLGNAMIERTAEQLWRCERKRFSAVTAAPSLIAHRRRHPEMWRLTMAPKMKPALGKTSAVRGMATSAGRLTTSWKYIPEELRRDHP